MFACPPSKNKKVTSFRHKSRHLFLWQTNRTRLIAKRFGSRDGLDDSSDTMEQLNQMISKFESLSSKPNSVSKKAAGNNAAATLERLRLNNALREVFANRFCHIFLSYEHFVILQQDIEDDLTPDGLDKENTMVSSKLYITLKQIWNLISK